MTSEIVRAPHLHLHGHPAVSLDQRELPLARKHGAALLAFLHEQRGPIARDAVAASLWPDASPTVGRGRLRRLIHEMHAELGCAVVGTGRDTLWLVEGVTSDLQRTRDSLDSLRGSSSVQPAEVDALLASHAAALMAGFTLGSDAFDEWLDITRRAHRAAWTEGVERLATLAVDTGDAALAERAAAALLRDEPCSEAGHVARLQARALLDDAAGVETAYLECAERLREELGVKPSPRVEAAYLDAIDRARRAQPRSPIEFACTATGDVAYTIWGQGATTLVVLWGLMSNLEIALEEPRGRALLDALAIDHRIVMFDRRGTGLSERVGITPSAATVGEDIVAVLDHLQIRRAWLFGASVGGTLSLDFASRYPERIAGLVLFGTNPCGHRTPETPWALAPDRFDAWIARLTDPAHYDESLRRFAPSAADDPRVRDWYARILRQSSTRFGTIQLLRMFQSLDVRDRLATIAAPVLVMHREGERHVPVQAARMLVAGLPRARLELLPGIDHFIWHGDTAPIVAAVREFIAAH